MLALLSLFASPADAFCGFYVGGAGSELYNDATVVVMMRDGTKTVLSMQNAYDGPPEAFAMVVPVPVVLKKTDVKTLPSELFGKVDSLSAPRLVEYWEGDPCAPPLPIPTAMRSSMLKKKPSSSGRGVKIEAQFAVGEYDIVILSAKDSTGLDTWLREENYNIPAGAEPVLRGYVQQGTKFFVAKVDPDRVTFKDGRAVLSPLRMAYDSKTFNLPIRLGMLNSRGEQDLLVHILATDRYEAANLPNVTIPTNLVVSDAVKDDFAGFYEAVFANARADAAGAVVTEYSWDSSSCDPCPGPTLTPQDLTTLGGDVIGRSSGLTLTRLHHRYDNKTGSEDLVFSKAPPLMGGIGTPDENGELQGLAKTPHMNMFQGRYAMLHRWKGEKTCESPRANWGGPPTGAAQTRTVPGRLGGGPLSPPANLASMVVSNMPPAPIQPPSRPTPARPEPSLDDEPVEKNCSTSGSGLWSLSLLLPVLLRRRSSTR